MSQVSRYLRRVQGGYDHFCPACNEPHVIFDNWTFGGNVEAPTFSPSVKITGKQTLRTVDGKWEGDWVRGPDGKAVDKCCHYVLTSGQVQFQADCTHAFKGTTVPLPELPEHMRDA